MRDLNAAGQSDYVLSIANALWTQLRLPINPEFSELMRREFDLVVIGAYLVSLLAVLVRDSRVREPALQPVLASDPPPG